MKAVVRFFIMATAGITAFSSGVSALDHELSGHSRTRFEYSKNPGTIDSTDSEGFYQRVRLNIDVMPAKALKVRIAPQANYVWGPAAPGTAAATNAGALTAHEAYMMYQMSDAWSITAGRQEVSFGNEVIFGDRDWTNGGLAHDAAKLTYMSGVGDHHLLWIRTQEGGTVANAGTSADPYPGTGNTEGDNEFFALYNEMGIDNESVEDLDVYLIWRNDRVAGARNRAVYLGGLVGGQIGTIAYGLELATTFGYSDGLGSDLYKGLMADANIGASLMDKHHVNLNIVYANTEWYDVAPDIHRHLGDSDLIGRNNVASIGLETKWMLSDVFNAYLDGYYFMRLNDEFTGGAQGAPGAPTGANDDKGLGFEGDIVLAYMPMDNVGFDFGYAFVKPMGQNDTAATAVMHDLYVQGTLSF